MLSDRLPLALERGVYAVPETGRIAVFGPRSGDDLSDLPKDRTDLILRHAPDHAAFAAEGYSVTVRPAGGYATAIICLPRAKAEAQATIAEARAATAGPLLIDGAKTDGVDRVLKDARSRAEVGEVLSKAHGKIFTINGGDFADWTPEVTRSKDGYVIPPGAFSADGIDPGSAALVAALPRRFSGHVVDLGAGWGYLASEVLTREAVTGIDLVEADHAALEAARQNVPDRRAAFHWADARAWAGTPADHVVMNPPFHTGRKGDTELGQAFIRQSARILKPSGMLWLVANRHLPYEQTLNAAFANVQELDGTGAFKLFSASKPRQSTLRKSKG